MRKEKTKARIGLAQMDILWEDVKYNQKKAEDFFREAKEKDVDLLIFPEMSLTGFSMNIKKTTANWREQTDFFLEMSRKYESSVIFGYPAPGKMGEGKPCHNHLALAQRGVVIMDYIKIHPFSYGQEGDFFQGGEQVVCTAWEDTVLGGFVCYDLRFPEIFQMSSARSELIAVIANWPESRVDQWDCLLRARAIENQCYVAGVNRVGEGGGLFYDGHSALYAPDGRQITKKSRREELLIGDCDWEEVRSLRETFPVKKDRKEQLYTKMFLSV